MELTERNFEQIGTYVREHLRSWIRDISPPITAQIDPAYLERMVRVEEELKSQRELMKQGFEAMDKRFEERRADMTTRFEAMDRRFEERRADTNARFDDARHHTNVWLSVLTIVIALTSFAGPLLAAFLFPG